MSDFNFKLFEDDSDEYVFRSETAIQIDLKRSERFLEKWLQKELKIQKNSNEIMVQIYDVSEKLPINYNPGGLE